VPFVLGLYGFIVGRIEQINEVKSSIWSRLIYGSVVTTSVFWFWYGDMYIVRALMGALLLGAAYRLWAGEFIEKERLMQPRQQVREQSVGAVSEQVKATPFINL